MTQETVRILRGMAARDTDVHAEYDALSWAEHKWSVTFNWPAWNAALAVIEQRRDELWRAEGHQIAFRQWAAHRACEKARGYEQCVRAACRLYAAYDNLCGEK